VTSGIRTRGALLWGAGTAWSVEEVVLEPPGPGEVLVAMAAAGICDSDEHFVSGDSIPSAELLAAPGGEEPYPFLGGHEGAGVVAEVGPGVTGLREGDHVVTS
jgi:Zn-dependent alcohol dehydrogenase